ncbi:MAG: TonB family protein [Alphaproteobacteria bacterium]|nr:TonB family protein [Alphaproteobacteria bacterium]
MVLVLWLGAPAPAYAVTWPLPDCSEAELAGVSPAPAASDTSSMKALPFVMLPRPVTAAFVVGLDAAYRPLLRCVIRQRSDWGLIADASVAAAGLVLSAPPVANRTAGEGRYLLRVSTNFGFTWVAAPPPYPIMPDCQSLPRDGGSAHAPISVPVAPKPVTRVQPVYPPPALAEEMEGEVQIWLDIFSDGSASPICIYGGTPPGWFEKAALEAVEQWRFQPRTGMGRYGVTVKFKMED